MNAINAALDSRPCRKAMWWGHGGRAGLCGEPAYGKAAEGSRWSWVNPACPRHGGPAPYVDVVFDGPPGPESGRFVEVEGPDGSSVRCGEWVERADGSWALRLGGDTP